jgi:anion-transporting  ArsA/GET3 family ATPase
VGRTATLDRVRDRRFVFVTGKGGVGKTSVCAALAVGLARQGKRILVAMSGPHERLSAMLRTPPIGHDIRELREGVWATRIQPERAIAEYGEIVLRVKSVARAVLGNRHTAGFFRAVPGLFDWAVLGKAWFHAIEEIDGAPRFDVILFDAPSTGHGLDMLRVPKVIVELVPPGALQRDAARAWGMFRDPAQCGVLVVGLAEDMPTTETIELCGALAELGLPLARVVVNEVLEPLFDAKERDALLAEPELLDPATVLGPAGPPVRACLASAARRAAREETQRRNLERLERALGERVSTLPLLFEGAGTPEAVGALAAELEA